MLKKTKKMNKSFLYEQYVTINIRTFVPISKIWFSLIMAFWCFSEERNLRRKIFLLEILLSYRHSSWTPKCSISSDFLILELILLDISHQGVIFVKRHSKINYLFSFPSVGNPSLRFRKGIWKSFISLKFCIRGHFLNEPKKV